MPVIIHTTRALSPAPPVGARRDRVSDEHPISGLLAVGRSTGPNVYNIGSMTRLIGRHGRPGSLALALAVVALTAGASCRRADAPPAGGEARPAGGSMPAAGPRKGRPAIVVLGDSLTAGYGLPQEAAFPALLQLRLDAAGYAYDVVNMGVSADTSAGGVSRVEWALDGDVRVLVVALGANDGLRGLSTEGLRNNLARIVEVAQRRGVRVLLCGMQAPPNFGLGYTMAFREVYREVAREKGVAFVPFLLEGVAGIPSLNQADGIHPNAEGARKVADLVWTHLEPLLQALKAT
jgi:acyl-CoA thioesterase-1